MKVTINIAEVRVIVEDDILTSDKSQYTFERVVNLIEVAHKVAVNLYQASLKI